MLEQYFQAEEIEQAKNLFTIFHDDLLMNQALSNTEAALLTTYMCANKHETNFIDKNKVKRLFASLGREKTDFSKAAYELRERRSTPLLKEEEGKIGVTFEGVDKVQEVLREGSNND